MGEVGRLGIVFADEFVEDGLDVQLQLALLEEGQDPLDGQSVLDVLVCSAQYY